MNKYDWVFTIATAIYLSASYYVFTETKEFKPFLVVSVIYWIVAAAVSWVRDLEVR